MPSTAKAVANTFLDLAEAEGRILTNMQVQKLVFLAQGYCLVFFDRELFSDDIRAWEWGPVVPSLYKALKQYGSGGINARIPDVGKPVTDPHEKEFIRELWKAYGHFSGMQLSALTHLSGSPWSETWAEEKYSVIPLSRIKAYYWEKVDRAVKEQSGDTASSDQPVRLLERSVPARQDGRKNQ